MIALLSNPEVISLLITALTVVVGFGWRKLMALLDGHWSRNFLDGAVRHAGHASEMALIRYREQLEAATDPDSDEGEVVTEDERTAAIAVAKEAFLEEISLKKLGRALSLSRGKKVSDIAAGDFAEELVEKAVDRAVPFDAASTK